MLKREYLSSLTILGLAARLVTPQLIPDCNPLKSTCPPNKAWLEESYYIDFTKETEPPPNWVIASHETVKFTPNGTEFAYGERKNAPHMWTDFYMLGGRYDVEMKIASGQGIVGSAVLWSDVQDEIDWEFTGNQHGEKPFPPPDGQWTIETNVFSHGNTLTRSFSAKDTPQGFMFPLSSMKLQIGLWGGGDPDNSDWTVQWAGASVSNRLQSRTFNSIERLQDDCYHSGTSDSSKPPKIVKEPVRP
ncbi:hypothetical protein DL762_007000 [Monosporascus cannonballus]|uniref:GH16 domain-containing protein n=1 Tax=Monosporascus cannonballus TaxID=155416 RepID=A0ABY0H4R4_9PEZI|nr:hypothetical protein DL762_007000 [Monosporascus cannonballus]